MAAITAVEHLQDLDGRTTAYMWQGVTEADDPSAVRIDDFSDMTISVVGTFNGSSVSLHVSSYSSTNGYIVANNANDGTAIGLTATLTGAPVAECGHWYKPVNDKAGTSESYDIVLACK